MGTADYGAVHRLQLELVAARRREEIPDTLLLLEHNPVITVGRAADGPGLRVGRSELQRRGVTVVECERGGEVTYHGPGQLVAYPIIDLRNRGRDLHRYLRRLEETIIIVLSELGVAAQRQPGLTGVWVAGAKIASIGIAVRHWVSFHGFALNVTCDLEAFNWIVPCDLPGVSMTSLKQVRPQVAEMTRVRELIGRSFCTVFEINGQVVPAADLLVRSSA